MKLTIIVPRLHQRDDALFQALRPQVEGRSDVEVLSVGDYGTMSIGQKMNILNASASGKYIAGIGDDDLVSEDYVAELLKAIDENDGVDVIVFDVEYWHNGELWGVMQSDKDCGESQGVSNRSRGYYLRSPSPKMCIRADFCKGYDYPHISEGEDLMFARWLQPQLETQHRIDKILYYKYFDPHNPFGADFRKARDRAA